MLAHKAVAVGHARPRIAPPMPLRSDVAAFLAQSEAIGIELMPWQDVAATYIDAQGPDDRHLYREIAVVGSRRNGKTELLVPHIVKRLRAGRHILHTAQNRELPREVYGRVADVMLRLYPDELKSKPRYANGQELMETRVGGRYRIIAPSRSGARGHDADDLIVDEVRELDDFDFVGAAKPALAQSRDPQTLWLSNAGDDTSAVLNSIRARLDSDPLLAYLEWSASPERDIGDEAGWLEANPAVGELDGRDMMGYLRGEFLSYTLAGVSAIFETEHLCRWVVTMRERLVDEFAWLACEGETETPRRPYMAVAMDPSGTRASAAVAWQQSDGTVALQVLLDTVGRPVDTDLLGQELRETAQKLGVREVGYDPMTDRDLARFFPKTKAISGSEFDNASSRFELIVKAGRLRWQDAEAVTADLTFTAKRQHDGARFTAVRANDDRPITAALAAIRSVWMVERLPSAALRVY